MRGPHGPPQVAFPTWQLWAPKQAGDSLRRGPGLRSQGPGFGFWLGGFLAAWIGACWLTFLRLWPRP